MAESTIGIANLGIFTAIDMKENETVRFPEIVVPLLFREWGYHGDNPDGTLWDRYIWDAPSVNMEPKHSDLFREDSAAVFVPGVGCTINSYLEMNNIHSTHGSEYDTVGLHRSRDPGAGAFSPYHHSKTTISRDVPAGSELFASYGDNWIPEIEGAVIAFDDNLDDAEQYLHEYADWMESSGLDDNVKQGLWELTNDNLFPTMTPLMSALPRQQLWKDVAAEIASPTNTEGSVVRHFIREQGKRSVEWLQKNGKCQDHLKPGNSTIPQAGRGAFASRSLPKGTVMAYAPLIHIGNQRSILEIEYNHDPKRMKDVHDQPNYKTEDIIINYSFFHPESTMLLTPYGAMVNYINHDRERANVRVEWPDRELVAHKPWWLNKTVDFLTNTQAKIGLSFDYVALRDIAEGEEIFMDYGPEWEEAWKEHIDSWKPVGPANYQHSSTWNETALRTVSEEITNPYPANLQTLCINSYTQISQDRNFYLEPVSKTHKRVHCDVLERFPIADKPDEYTYTVRLRPNMNGEDPVVSNSGTDSDSDGEESSKDGPAMGRRGGKQVINSSKYGFILVHNVPKVGVDLYDKLQSGDWHLRQAFRHPMKIPDHVMRENWKNVGDDEGAEYDHDEGEEEE